MSSATTAPVASKATWPAVKTWSPLTTTGEYGAFGVTTSGGWIASRGISVRESVTCDRVEEVRVAGDRPQRDPVPALWRVACVRASREPGLAAPELREAEDVRVRPELLHDLDDRRNAFARDLERLGPQADHDGLETSRRDLTGRRVAQGDPRSAE